MKKLLIVKALMLLLFGAAIILPMRMRAQQNGDDFFRTWDNENNDRDAATAWTFTNQTFGDAPLGGGLIILTAAAAGYAILRRKRIRKSIMMTLVLTIILSLTQCKKKLETITADGEKVYITLNVGSGSRHDVNPATGQVAYAEGDVIYVGNAGKYIGTLTCSKIGDNYVFGGDITDPQTTDYLHFYFVGGLTLDNITPDGDILIAGETTSFDVDIFDQSSKLPVLSYVHTAEHYVGGTSYNCMLENKCGLVKFTLTNGTLEAVKITGMKTGATINFADPSNPIVANGTKDAISLKSESETEKWAILLPQDAVSDGLALINGVAYSCDVAAVENNSYITTNTIDNTTPSKDKVFTVSKNGNVVRFSLGNLQYDQTTQKYSFMEHQYDMVETENQNVGNNYSNQNIVSLFSWGTGDKPTMTSEDTLDYEVFKDWGDYCGDPTGHSYHWYTLSEDEWEWLIGVRIQAVPGVTCRDGNRFLHARITVDNNSYYGVIVFPDGYDIAGYTYNNYQNVATVSDGDWSSMEAAGAVFLPAAGLRNGLKVESLNKSGGYWSNTLSTNHAILFKDRTVYLLVFMDDFYTSLDPSGNTRRIYGQSVRLVR